MHIVIDISEEDFTCLKDAYESGDWERLRFAEMTSAELLLREGTILRGHGRLIDADELKTIRSIQNKYANFNSIETIQEWIDHAPTIIETDEELNNGKIYQS